MPSHTTPVPKDDVRLTNGQHRRVAALTAAQRLVAGGPALFAGAPNKLERKVDDVIDLAEFILHGDRMIRSRDGKVHLRFPKGYREVDFDGFPDDAA